MVSVVDSSLDRVKLKTIINLGICLIIYLQYSYINELCNDWLPIHILD
jgi:hypothetical protein